LTGIIAVQLYWIRNAIRIKEEQFDRSVNEALQVTVKKLETTENAEMIKGKLQNPGTDSTYLFAKDNRHSYISRVKITDTPVNSCFVAGKIQGDTTRNIIVFREQSGDDSILVGYNIHACNYSLDTIHLNRENQGVTVITKDNQKDSVYIIVGNQMKRINRKSKDLEMVFERMVVEVASRHKSIEDRLDTTILKQIIQNSLIDNGIEIPFEYAILNSDSATKPVIQTAGFTARLTGSVYKVNLFPNDVIEKENYLILDFPDKWRHVYKSLAFLMAGSSFFTFFIIITFTLTLLLIFRQKKISEIKSDFINNMTHEFKTPIATISLAADSLSNEKVYNNKSQVIYFSGIIKEESKRMNSQVENVLQMALLDKKDFKLKFELTDVHDLIKTAIKSVSIQIERKEGKIESFLESEKFSAYTDKVHFTNILYNLLDNAIKYSNGKPDIKVGTYNNTKGIFIYVEDKGIGMNTAMQSKIFDKFYRASSGNVHNVKGFGLGLSYVKAIVTANSGTIMVRSKPGEGSRFTVFLPYTRREIDVEE
jgi:two-component system phosphate regulon sensor histidine kinase PhoR